MLNLRIKRQSLTHKSDKFEQFGYGEYNKTYEFADFKSIPKGTRKMTKKEFQTFRVWSHNLFYDKTTQQSTDTIEKRRWKDVYLIFENFVGLNSVSLCCESSIFFNTWNFLNSTHFS